MNDAKPFLISDLVAEIGSENIAFQNLDKAAVTLDFHHKRGTTITFVTEEPLTPNGTERLGLVLWFSREAVASVLSSHKTPPTGGQMDD